MKQSNFNRNKKMDRWTFPLINDAYELCIGWVKKGEVLKSYDEDSS